VAIARALANDPHLILADEPTGNLDTATGRQILDLLGGLHAEGKTLVVVTHEPAVAARAENRLYMVDGIVDTEKSDLPSCAPTSSVTSSSA
jgi:putative ABC transport system ATP-binding protein